MTRIGVLVPYEGGDGSWIDGALAAAEALGDLAPAVQVGVPSVLPDWDVVVGHGIQYEELVRRDRRPGQTVILSDVPYSRAGLDGVACVEWSWDLGAYCAGAVAADLARERGDVVADRAGAVAGVRGGAAAGSPDAPDAPDGAVEPGGPSDVAPAIGLIAGPAVRTQARLAMAFARGASREPLAEASGAASVPPEIAVVHLRSFDAVEGGRAAGEQMVEALGCAVVAHTADAAGAAGVERARELGAATMGFLGEAPGAVLSIRSDIAGVLAGLVRRAVAGEELPELTVCDLDNGGLRLDFAEDAPARLRETAAAAAAEYGRGLG